MQPAPPPPVDLAQDLREHVRLSATNEAVQELLRRGLDWLGRIAPYDLATIFLLRDSKLVVQAARGKMADERVKGHSLLLTDFPTIKEALETRRARAFTEA